MAHFWTAMSVFIFWHIWSGLIIKANRDWGSRPSVSILSLLKSLENIFIDLIVVWKIVLISIHWKVLLWSRTWVKINWELFTTFLLQQQLFFLMRKLVLLVRNSRFFFAYQDVLIFPYARAKTLLKFSLQDFLFKSWISVKTQFTIKNVKNVHAFFFKSQFLEFCIHNL